MALESWLNNIMISTNQSAVSRWIWTNESAYLVVRVAEALAPSILQVAVEGHSHSGQL